MTTPKTARGPERSDDRRNDSEAQNKFIFVPEFGHKSSQKQRELVRSLQRSHASRITHLRRRSANEKKEVRLPCEICDLSSTKPRPCTHQPPPQKSGLSLITWKGNSDPFDSQSVAITPRFNQLLDFYGRIVIPTIADSFLGSLYGSLSQYSGIKPTTAGFVYGSRLLQEPCSATTFMFATLSLMNRFCEGKGLVKEISALHVKSIRELRLAMAESFEASGNVAVLNSIFQFLKAAVYAEDTADAGLHSAALCRLAFNGNTKGHLYVAFLTVAIWRCMMLSSRSLTAHSRNRISPMSGGSECDVPLSQPFRTVALDEGVNRGPYRGYYIAIWQAWLARQDPNPSICTGVNVEFEAMRYLFLPEKVDQDGSPSAIHSTAQSVADNHICAISLNQYCGMLGGEAVFSTRAFRGDRPILDILQTAISDGWSIASRNVLLFSCCLGALVETEREEGCWFYQRIVSLSMGMSWRDIKSISDGFLPLEPLLPDSLDWEVWFRLVRTRAAHPSGP